MEKSIGEEAVPEVAGKAAGRWRDLPRRVEVHVVYHARMGGVYDLAMRPKLEQEAKQELEQEAQREHNRAMQSVLWQSSHPAEFIALGGDEQAAYGTRR